MKTRYHLILFLNNLFKFIKPGIFPLLLSALPSGSYSQFQKAYGNSLDNSFSKVIKDGNNYYVLGQDEPQNGSTMRATVTRVDATGTHLWTLRLDVPSVWNDAILTPSGDLLLVGSTLPFDAKAKSIAGRVSVSLGGSFTWLKSFDAPGQDGFFRIVRNPVPLNILYPYYVLGFQNQTGSASTTDDVVLLNLNEAGSFQWKKIYAGNGDDEYYRDLEAMSNGDLVMAGNSGNGLIFRTDNAGNVLNGLLIPQRIFNDVAQASSNGIYTVSNDQSNSGAHLMRLLTNLLPLYDVIIPELSHITQVWPGQTGKVYIVGTGSVGGQVRTLLIKISDLSVLGNTSLSVDWVKYLNVGTNSVDGAYWKMPNSDIAYADSRLTPSGFGQSSAFLAISDQNLTNCLVSNDIVSIKAVIPVPSSPILPQIKTIDVLTPVNLTYQSINWQDQTVCNASPCIVAFTFTPINTCGNFQFTNQSTATPPVTFAWNFGDPGSGLNNTSTSQVPSHQFSKCGDFLVCLKITSPGCKDSMCQTISFKDLVKPIITCPPNITEACAPQRPPTIPATATDNCTPTADIVITNTSFSSQGTSCNLTYFLTWEAQDACLNKSNCTQIIVYKDELGPVITCPPNITLQCNANTSPAITGMAHATDNCTVTSHLLFTYLDNLSGTSSCNGTITRTWQTKDDCNNISTCKQIISINDNISPTITCPPNQTLECNTSTKPPATGVATAIDNCTAINQITITYSDLTSGTPPCNGSIVRTWEAKDDCKNISACKQVISIVDKVAPVINCPKSTSVTCDADTSPKATGKATATDNCTGPIQIVITYSDLISGKIPCDETITRIWQATDACNNTTTCKQIISIKDEVAPKIKCPKDEEVYTNTGVCYYTGNIPRPTASDNCDLVLDIQCTLQTSTGSVPITSLTQFPKGVNTITCFAIDDCGNISPKCNFTLTVKDNEPPKITCPINISVLGTLDAQGQCKAIINNIASIASDNCPMLQVGYSISGNTLGSGIAPAINDASGTAFMGNSTITYMATDMAGNSSSCSFTISVNCNQRQTIDPCCPDFELVHLNGPSKACCSKCDKLGEDSARVMSTDSCETMVVCKNSKSQFIVYPNLPNFSYQWTISGGSPTTIVNGNPVEIQWGNGPNGYITVIITDGNGCTKTISQEVCFMDSPDAGFTFSPFNNICTGTDITFTNTSTGGITYSWDFGDGTSSQLVNPHHQYTTPGTYTVTLVVSNAMTVLEKPCGCIDTFKQIITVSAGGGIVPGCKEMICPGDTVEYCSSMASCASYSWVIQGGTIIGSSTKPCVWVVWQTAPGSLTLTDCSVCSPTTITPNVIWPSIPIQGPTTVCVGSINTYSLPVLPGTFYSWSVSAGATILNSGSYPSNYPINNSSVNVSFPYPGTFNLICNYNNPNTENHCGGRDTITIKVLPEFKISGGPTVACQYENSFFYFPNANWVITGPAGGWSILNSSPGFIFVQWLLPGNYVINATASPSTPFCNTSASINITVKPAPVLSFVSPILQICTNNLTDYKLTSNLSGNVTWTFSSGSGGNIFPYGTDNMNASIQFIGNGPWTLQATQDVAGCPKGTATIIINKVAPPPPINPINSICSGESITASVGGTPPPGGYVWSSTPGAVLTGGQGTTTATFTINSNATISVSNCSGTSSLPVSTITSTVLITKTNTPCGATLTASPGWTNYDWYLNGSFLTSGNPINITQNGTYVVVATTLNGCKANYQLAVTGLNPVSVSISAIGNLCNGGTVTLNATNTANCTGANYVWHNSNNSTTFIGNPYPVTSAGTYWVTIMCQNGCSDISNAITVSSCPSGPGTGTPCIPDLIISNSNCDNPVTLTATTLSGCTAVNTTWYFGDGSSGTSGYHAYTNIGNYTVIAVMTCADSSVHCGTQNISIPFVDSFTYVIVCNSPFGWQVLLQDATTYISGYTTNWITSCGSLSSTNIPNPTLTVPPGCNPKVTLEITDPITGCMLSYSHTFNFPTTAFSINGSTTTCKNDTNFYSTNFTTGVISYLWNFGDGTSGVTNPIAHQFDGVPPNPTISLTITDTWGCMFTTTQVVQVIIPPALHITPSPLITICPTCPPVQTLSVTTPLLFTGYQWYHNDSAISGAIFPTYDLCPNTDPGNYYVSALSKPDACAVNSDTVHVILHPLPIADIQPGNIQCVPNYPYLSSFIHNSQANLNYTYDWYLDNVSGPPIFSSSTTNYLTYTIPSDSCYTFILKVTDTVTHCTAFDTACICFSKSPTVSIIPNGVFCAGDPITFTATAGPLSASDYTYVWQDGTLGQSYTTSFAGIYTVTATNKFGCYGIASSQIKPLPYLELFPQGCDTLCDTAHLYFPIPLSSSTYPVYTITWYEATTPNPTNIGSGYSIPISSLSTGMIHNIFCIVNLNGCLDTTGMLNLFIKHCTGCGCDSSAWSDITLVRGRNVQVTKLACGTRILHILDCNTPYFINTNFMCKDSACPSKVTYTLLPPSGPPVSGPVGFSFTPDQTGIYLVTLYGWCGDKICDSCKISFVTDCPDSCTCDSNSFEFEYGVSRQNLKPAHCGDTLIAPPSSSGLAVNLYSFFHCTGDNCDSITTVEWTLSGPNLLPYQNIATTLADGSFPNPISSALFTSPGLYTLNLLGICGQDTCPCTIYFNQPESCCQSYDVFCSNIMNAVQLTLDSVNCKITANIGSLPTCDSIVSINWGDNQTSSSHVGSGGMAMHTYTLSGTYIISWLATEYNYSTNPPVLCFKKLFTDTIMVKCCDTCSCGTFDFLYAVSRGPFYSKHCGDTLGLPLTNSNLSITFISSFSCMGTNCTNDSVEWALSGPSPFSQLTGKVLPTPLFAISAITSSTFTVAGLYTLILTGHCGHNSCPPCKIYFYQPENCCQTYDLFLNKINSAVNINVDNDHCKAILTINGLASCDSIVQVNWGDNQSSSVHLGSGSMSMHTYAQSGTYIISYTAYEYNSLIIPAKICFEKVFRDTITVNCCGDCKNNLVKNPGFSLGAIAGDLGHPGASSNWLVASGSPQVGLTQGCCDSTIIQMWGNRDVGEAICQSFNFIPGHTYSIRFHGLFYGNVAGLTTPYVKFGFTAANGCINPFSCSSTNCVPIGSSIDITDTACKEYSIVNWTAPATPLYNTLIIRAFNNNANSPGNFSNISFGRLDNVCIRDVSIITSDPKLKFTAINMIVKPNPATDKVIISITSELNKPKNILRLISLEGKILKSITLYDREAQINMEEYPSGLYFISLYDVHGQMLTTPAKLIKK